MDGVLKRKPKRLDPAELLAMVVVKENDDFITIEADTDAALVEDNGNVLDADRFVWQGSMLSKVALNQ